LRQRDAQQSEAGLAGRVGAQKLIGADRAHAKKYQGEGADKFSDNFLGLRIHQHFSWQILRRTATLFSIGRKIVRERKRASQSINAQMSREIEPPDNLFMSGGFFDSNL
jgi:hypothetical protein